MNRTELRQLASERIGEGKRFVDQLRGDGVDVAVAFWALSSYDEAWFLYIATPIVDSKGVTAAYGRVFPSLDRSRVDSFADPSVRLISDRDPIAREALIYQQEREIFHYQGRTLGKLIVDEAYIYPKE